MGGREGSLGPMLKVTEGLW